VTVVLEIRNIQCDGDYLVVDAVVAEAVLTAAATHRDPPEYGPALCRGTLYVSDDMRIGPTDRELMDMLGREIDDWKLITND
jgi:hypothetical protein